MANPPSDAPPTDARSPAKPPTEPPAPATDSPPAVENALLGPKSPALLPKKQFFGYALGFLGPVTLLSLVNVLLQNYYMMILGLDAFLTGLGLTIGLVIYSFCAILFGQVGDNFAGKWARKVGKRKFFLLVSFVPMVVAFVLVWMPPPSLRPTTFGETNWGTALWLWTFSAAYHFCFSVFNPAYWALLPEISHDEDERVRLSIFQNFGRIFGSVIGILVPVIFFSTSADTLFWNAGPDSQGSQVILQMIVMAIAFGGLSVFTVLLTLKTVVEPPLEARVTTKKSLGEFARELFGPLRENRAFLLFTICVFFYNITARILMMDIILLVDEVLLLEGGQWAAFMLVLVGVGVGSFVLWDKIKAKKGFKFSFSLNLALSTGVMFFTAIFLVLPDPLLFPVGIFFAIFGVTSLIGLMIFPNPIVAALVDKHCVEGCVERSQLSGKYSGIYLFFMNISNAVAAFFYGWLFKVLGTTPVTIVLVLVFSGIFIGVAFGVYQKVDLTPGVAPTAREA